MATQEDIAHHYDVSNEFYFTFLDKLHHAYSCAVWDHAKDLEEAQTAKLKRIADFAGVSPGDRVMDVGCGWGGMMQFLVNTCKAHSVFGLTLSTDQYNYIASQPNPHISTELKSWQAYSTDSKFDAILSIGAFEHFASLEDRAKHQQIQIYKQFFDWCLSNSTDEAKLGLQTIITPRKPRNISELRDTRYLLNHVFPGTASPTFGDIESAISGKYEIVEQKNIGSHYSITLTEWKRRLNESKSIIIENYGSTIYEHYDRYFEMAKRGFDSGLLDLLQLSLKRL
jgi:cyclopropane-fatty-acyl-phospholipid synthase